MSKNSTLNEVLVANIEYLCELKGLAPTSMLASAGVSKNLLNDLRTRGGTPSVMTAAKIAQYLDISVDALCYPGLKYKLNRVDSRVSKLISLDKKLRASSDFVQNVCANYSKSGRGQLSEESISDILEHLKDLEQNVHACIQYMQRDEQNLKSMKLE